MALQLSPSPCQAWPLPPVQLLVAHSQRPPAQHPSLLPSFRRLCAQSAPQGAVSTRQWCLGYSHEWALVSMLRRTRARTLTYLRCILRVHLSFLKCPWIRCPGLYCSESTYSRSGAADFFRPILYEHTILSWLPGKMSIRQQAMCRLQQDFTDSLYV